MSNATGTDIRADATRGGSGSGLGFSAGLLVGFAGAIAGLALAVVLERRRRRRQPGAEDSAARVRDAAKADDWQSEERELDEELDQTFPASDPLPHSHRVD
jgi:hypothetical protein